MIFERIALVLVVYVFCIGFVAVCVKVCNIASFNLITEGYAVVHVCLLVFAQDNTDSCRQI